MKRLEGEVLEALADLGGQEALRGLEGHTVDPHQFLGLEINPRAAAIAELVLWIGHLQWHLRTQDGMPSRADFEGVPQYRGEGRGAGGEGYVGARRVRQTRDAQWCQMDSSVEVHRYDNPKQPEWPPAEFIVGNPPFMAGQRFVRNSATSTRRRCGSSSRHEGGADFVMYWRDRAADILVQEGTVLRRFGLVTTNRITQEFSGRVVARHLKCGRCHIPNDGNSGSSLDEGH